MAYLKIFTVREYLRQDGSCPFRDWLEGLRIEVQARIQARIVRFEMGNLGDVKSVGEGVHEARCMFGPGYRVYFGRDGNELIVLLCGGDKGSQRKDIRSAKLFWKDYKERT